MRNSCPDRLREHESPGSGPVPSAAPFQPSDVRQIPDVRAGASAGGRHFDGGAKGDRPHPRLADGVNPERVPSHLG